jgi:hypothetical protein
MKWINIPFDLLDSLDLPYCQRYQSKEAKVLIGGSVLHIPNRTQARFVYDNYGYPQSYLADFIVSRAWALDYDEATGEPTLAVVGTRKTGYGGTSVARLFRREPGGDWRPTTRAYKPVKAAFRRLREIELGLRDKREVYTKDSGTTHEQHA